MPVRSDDAIVVLPNEAVVSENTLACDETLEAFLKGWGWVAW